MAAMQDSVCFVGRGCMTEKSPLFHVSSSNSRREQKSKEMVSAKAQKLIKFKQTDTQRERRSQNKIKKGRGTHRVYEKAQDLASTCAPK
jgi:hypothetical protein